MAAEGMGCKEIAKALNRQGISTAKGERWGRVTVHKILTNEAYCGTRVVSPIITTVYTLTASCDANETTATAQVIVPKKTLWKSILSFFRGH
jgi:hypothetical protein